MQRPAPRLDPHLPPPSETGLPQPVAWTGPTAQPRTGLIAAARFQPGEVRLLDWRTHLGPGAQLPGDAELLALFPAHPSICPIAPWSGVLVFQSWSMQRAPRFTWRERGARWGNGVYAMALTGPTPPPLVYGGGRSARQDRLAPVAPGRGIPTQLGGAPRYLLERVDPGPGFVFVGVIGDDAPSPWEDAPPCVYTYLNPETGAAKATFQL